MGAGRLLVFLIAALPLAAGAVAVDEEVPAAPVVVQLRPLLEVTPGGPENPQAVSRELPPELAAAMAAPAEAPVAGRGGAYKVRFADRSPWSARTEVFRRAGPVPAEIQSAADQALAYELAAETYQVLVPQGAAPAQGWGLFVWVSPGPFGGTLRPEMHSQLAAHRLIWVGANGSGNTRVRWDRWGLALDAVANLRKLYPIDAERVYVGGYSGGGRAASALLMLYPDVFRAGLMVMGVDWCGDLPIPDHPGAHWPANFDRPPRDLYRLAHARRFVLLTGERDFNRQQTRVIRDVLAKNDFQRVTYLEVPGMSHYDPWPGEWLAKAFAALDPPPAADGRGQAPPVRTSSP